MAGRIPGVGLFPRKRTEHHLHNHRYHQHHAFYRDSYVRESLVEAPWLSVSFLDETTLKARQRLQKKLGQFFSSSRSSVDQRKEGKRRQSKCQKKDGGLGRRLLESSWLLLGNKFKKERKVCAVCLEDCQQEEQVMNLSCSHKYHSACLLPWLAAHPHCPYCRTPVEPISS